MAMVALFSAQNLAAGAIKLDPTANSGTFWIQEIHKRSEQALMSKRIGISDQRDPSDYESFSLVCRWDLRGNLQAKPLPAHHLDLTLLWPDKRTTQTQIYPEGFIGRISYTIELKSEGYSRPPIAYQGKLYDTEGGLLGYYAHPLWHLPIDPKTWEEEPLEEDGEMQIDEMGREYTQTK
jgi:hypothetical protein